MNAELGFGRTSSEFLENNASCVFFAASFTHRIVDGVCGFPLVPFLTVLPVEIFASKVHAIAGVWSLSLIVVPTRGVPTLFQPNYTLRLFNVCITQSRDEGNVCVKGGSLWKIERQYRVEDKDCKISNSLTTTNSYNSTAKSNMLT